MKRVIAALILLLVFSPSLASTPSKYTDYHIDIEIREDKIINETINIAFPDNVTAFDYYLLHPAFVRFFDINGREIINCASSLEGSGTIVGCKNISLSSIAMQFEYDKLIRQNSTSFILSDQYIFLTPSDAFTLKVILPKGYVVSENLSYSPEGVVQGTNGKQIYLEWKVNQPKLGTVFSYSAAYEKALSTPDNQGLLIFIGFAGAVAVALLVMIYFRKAPTLKEYGLNNDERKILDVLLKENKISQKKIVRETGFSKAHVSRISKNLEERGIIERNKRGRTYEVILKQ